MKGSSSLGLRQEHQGEDGRPRSPDLTIRVLHARPRGKGRSPHLDFVDWRAAREPRSRFSQLWRALDSDEHKGYSYGNTIGRHADSTLHLPSSEASWSRVGHGSRLMGRLRSDFGPPPSSRYPARLLRGPSIEAGHWSLGQCRTASYRGAVPASVRRANEDNRFASVLASPPFFSLNLGPDDFPPDPQPIARFLAPISFPIHYGSPLFRSRSDGLVFYKSQAPVAQISICSVVDITLNNSCLSIFPTSVFHSFQHLE